MDCGELRRYPNAMMPLKCGHVMGFNLSRMVIRHC